MTDIRDPLQLRLNRLYLRTRQLRRELPEPEDFWPEFAGLADEILDVATPEEYDAVVGRLEVMLADNGLSPRG